jgi:hypothetical protein
MRRNRATIVAVEKAIRITYSESISAAFGSQTAMRMRRITSPSVACPAAPYFSTQSQKNGTIFEKRYLNIKYVF